MNIDGKGIPAGASDLQAKPTVFVVEDDDAVRDSFVHLMKAIGMQTVAFSSADGFLAHYEPSMLGCLVLDVRLPGMSGLQLQDELLARGIDLPIIFVSGYADLPMAVAAMKKGAFNFLEKPVRGQILLDDVNAAIALHQKRRQISAQSESVAARIATLTPRERQVLELIKLGKSTRAIAETLGISQKTTQVHRARILAKLQVETGEALVALLHRHHLA